MLTVKALMIGQPTPTGIVHYRFTFVGADGRDYQGPLHFARYYLTQPEGNPDNVRTIYVHDVNSVLRWDGNDWVNPDTADSQRVSENLSIGELNNILAGLRGGRNPFRDSQGNPAVFPFNTFDNNLAAVIKALVVMPIDELLKYKTAFAFLGNVTSAQIVAMGIDNAAYSQWKNRVTNIINSLSVYAPMVL